MKWAQRWLWVCCVLGANLLPTYAQQLSDYLGLAMESDPSFLAARLQREADAQYRVIGAAGLRPTVNLNAGLGAYSYRRQDIGSAKTISNDYNPATWSVQFNQPLYDPEKSAFAKEGDLRASRADLVLMSAHQDLAQRMANAWFGYLLNHDQLALAKMQLASLESQREQAQRMWTAGVATLTDVEETASRAQVAAADVIGAQAALTLASRNFTRIVGMQPPSVLNKSADRLAPNFARSDRTLEDWVALARQQSLMVRIQRLGVDIGRAQLDKARASLKPTVALVASQQNGRTPNYFTTSESTTQVGIQLSMNLYNGGGTTAQIQQVGSLLDKSEKDLLAAQEEAGMKVADAALAVEASLERVAALEKAHKAALVALEGMTAGQTAGIRTNTDVLNATQQLYLVKRDLARERYSLVLRDLERRLLAGEDVMSVIGITSGAFIPE